MRRVAVLMMFVAGMAPLAPGISATPMRFSYQGQLTDTSGAPINGPTAARFTVLWGGTASENPSTGIPVYQENLTLSPDAGGVFHHLIGAGSPTSQCDENRDGTAAEPCILAPNDFPSTGTIVYLELRLDPGGVNNLLTPRQQLVNAPYAMNAATIEGLSPADLVTSVVAGPGLTGSGTGSSVTLAIANLGVTAAMMGPGSVGPSNIQTNGVNSNNIATDTITAADIATGAVESAEIADAAITSADISNFSVTTAHIAIDTITAADIATGAVGSAEIADAAVSSLDISDGTVTSTDIAADTITAADIAPGGVGSSEIADASIATGDIGTGAVTNAKLALTPVLSTQIGTSSTTETQINLGSFQFCALATVASRFNINSGTQQWCRIQYVAPNWFLGARSNGTTEVSCEAFCF